MTPSGPQRREDGAVEHIRERKGGLCAEPPYPRLLPDLQRWDELVRWLAQLSDALSALGTAELLDHNASQLAR
jgi:hypothetical protein